MTEKKGKIEMTKILFIGRSGYSDKQLLIKSPGVYEITEAQKQYLITNFPKEFLDIDNPEAKDWIAKQNAEIEIQSAQKELANPPPWTTEEEKAESEIKEPGE